MKTVKKGSTAWLTSKTRMDVFDNGVNVILMFNFMKWISLRATVNVVLQSFSLLLSRSEHLLNISLQGFDTVINLELRSSGILFCQVFATDLWQYSYWKSAQNSVWQKRMSWYRWDVYWSGNRRLSYQLPIMSNKRPIADYWLPPTSITEYQLGQTKRSLPIPLIPLLIHYIKNFDPFFDCSPCKRKLDDCPAV